MSWNKRKLNLFKKELERCEKRRIFLETMVFESFALDAINIKIEIAEKIKNHPQKTYSPEEFEADKKRFSEKMIDHEKATKNHEKYMKELAIITNMIHDIVNDIYYLEKK